MEKRLIKNNKIALKAFSYYKGVSFLELVVYTTTKLIKLDLLPKSLFYLCKRYREKSLGI